MADIAEVIAGFMSYAIYGASGAPRWSAIWAVRLLWVSGAALVLLNLSTGLLSHWPLWPGPAWVFLSVVVAMGEYHGLERPMNALAVFATGAGLLTWALLAGGG